VTAVRHQFSRFGLANAYYNVALRNLLAAAFGVAYLVGSGGQRWTGDDNSRLAGIDTLIGTAFGPHATSRRWAACDGDSDSREQIGGRLHWGCTPDATTSDVLSSSLHPGARIIGSGNKHPSSTGLHLPTMPASPGRIRLATGASVRDLEWLYGHSRSI